MHCNLGAFDAELAQHCRTGLRAAMDEATTLEAAARAGAGFLFDALRDERGGRACAMVRCYKTHRIGALPSDVQRMARRAYGRIAFTPPEPTLKCLTLVATTGVQPEWNDRRQSRGHQAIPLPSPEIVARAPMIAQLIRELGLDLAQVVRAPDRVVYGSEDRALGVFHVENAAGSPYIPAQDFVSEHGIRSVVGFGGILPGGDIYAFILFARVPIGYDAADHFRSMARDATAILARYPAEAVFEAAEPAEDESG